MAEANRALGHESPSINTHEKKEAIFDSWNLRVTLQKKKKLQPEIGYVGSIVHR